MSIAFLHHHLVGEQVDVQLPHGIERGLIVARWPDGLRYTVRFGPGCYLKVRPADIRSNVICNVS